MEEDTPRDDWQLSNNSSLEEIGEDPNKEEECSENPPEPSSPAIDYFTSRLTNIMSHENVTAIRQDQAKMLHTMELANWKLSSLNDISESTFQSCSADFKHVSKRLVDMKKQLDSVFRRIRHLKAHIAATYPEAYTAAQEKCKMESDLDETESNG